MTRSLAYLEFDFSEDADGHGTFDAMASATAGQWPALQAEIVAVLDWAQRSFGAPGPLDEGGEWDVELQGVREVPTPLAVRYAPGTLEVKSLASGEPRTTVSVTLTGTAAFCEALRDAFAP